MKGNNNDNDNNNKEKDLLKQIIDENKEAPNQHLSNTSGTIMHALAIGRYNPTPYTFKVALTTLISEHGLEPDAVDDGGATALHIAVRYNTREIVCILLGLNGINPKATVLGSGDTILHSAIRSNKYDVVKLLATGESGGFKLPDGVDPIDINLKNQNKETALDLAVQLPPRVYNLINIVMLLVNECNATYSGDINEIKNPLIKSFLESKIPVAVATTMQKSTVPLQEAIEVTQEAKKKVPVAEKVQLPDTKLRSSSVASVLSRKTSELASFLPSSPTSFLPNPPSWLLPSLAKQEQKQREKAI